MKTEKPDIRYLCNRCWMNYYSAGYELKKVYCKYKEECWTCGHHSGYKYIVKEGRYQVVDK